MDRTISFKRKRKYKYKNVLWNIINKQTWKKHEPNCNCSAEDLSSFRTWNNNYAVPNTRFLYYFHMLWYFNEMVSVMSWFSNEAAVSEEAAATFLGQVRGQRGAVREQRDVPRAYGEMLRTWNQGNIRHQCRKRYETETLERDGLDRECVRFGKEGQREIVLLVEMGKRYRRMSLRNHRNRSFCQN